MTDDLQSRNDEVVAERNPEEIAGLGQEMPPLDASEERDEVVVPLQTMVSVIEDILQMLDIAPVETTTSPVVEHWSPSTIPAVVKRPHSKPTPPLVERIIKSLGFEPSVSTSGSTLRGPSEAGLAPGPRDSPLYSPLLTRSRSLPEDWRMSAFTVFAPRSPPPSPTPAPKPKQNKAKTTKMYMHVQMISSVESLAAPLQSGHAYVRDNMNMKNKIKTRPDARPESPIMQGVPLTRTYTGKSLLKKPSFFSRFGGHRRSDPIEEPQASSKPAGAKWVGNISKLTKTTAERMRVLVKGGGPNTRELSWKDFLKIMKELGFRKVELEGTAVKFHPPDPKDPVGRSTSVPISEI
ncbi:hypothetical protein B0H19DRAFT_54564 [Mycena capillaripes]|nr:hypothetical protein B0H19DRAFT_54564 [Mycena capillaripes]